MFYDVIYIKFLNESISTWNIYKSINLILIRKKCENNKIQDWSMNLPSQSTFVICSTFVILFLDENKLMQTTGPV